MARLIWTEPALLDLKVSVADRRRALLSSSVRDSSTVACHERGVRQDPDRNNQRRRGRRQCGRRVSTYEKAEKQPGAFYAANAESGAVFSALARFSRGDKAMSFLACFS